MRPACFFFLSFRYFLTNELHHHSTSVHLSRETGALGHFQRGLEKNILLCESESAERVSHNTLRSVLAQKGATAANKTFAAVSLGGGPWREGIRFQGNVSKIEFLEALSPYV